MQPCKRIAPVVFAFLTLPLWASAQTTGRTFEDVVRLLRDGTPTSRIATIVSQSCRKFAMTDAIADRLRREGADGTLIATIRGTPACKSVSAIAVARPSGTRPRPGVSPQSPSRPRPAETPAVSPTARVSFMTINQSVSGELSSSDPTLPDGTHYDVWQFSGQAGQRVRITMSSSDFDAYLGFGTMSGGTWESIATDDDGGDGTDAMIEATLSASGQYVVRANSLSAAQGRYTLSVQPATDAPIVAQGSMISAGQTVTGRLDTSDGLRDDGTYYDDWFYDGRAGENITVTQSSSDFDSWLLVGRMVNGVFQLDEFDDDGAGGNDSRITYTLPESGRYVIRVNVIGRGKTGAYGLRVDGSGGSTSTTSAGSGAVRTPSIAINQSVSGDLSASDPTLPDGTYYDVWQFFGRAGQRVRITMSSSDFDAYLGFGTMSGGTWESIDTDDDGGDGTDAMIEATLPASGQYFVRANSLSAAQGRYTLSVQSADAASVVQSSIISAGQTVTGRLDTSDGLRDDGTYYDDWFYDGRAGETITVTQSSSDFDSWLLVGRMVNGAFQLEEFNDDGAGGNDSRITYTLPASGRYVIRVNVVGRGRTGAYALRVDRSGRSTNTSPIGVRRSFGDR